MLVLSVAPLYVDGITLWKPSFGPASIPQTFTAVLMKTASVTVTFCQLTSHLASEAVIRPDISHQLPFMPRLS